MGLWVKLNYDFCKMLHFNYSQFKLWNCRRCKLENVKKFYVFIRSIQILESPFHTPFIIRKKLWIQLQFWKLIHIKNCQQFSYKLLTSTTCRPVSLHNLWTIFFENFLKVKQEKAEILLNLFFLFIKSFLFISNSWFFLRFQSPLLWTIP